MTRPLALAAALSLVAAALSLVAAALSGCAAARVRVDPALSSIGPLPVTGANPRRWGAPVRFGPHATGAVSGDTTLGWSVSVLGDIGLAGSHRPYAWTSTGPAGSLAVECHQRSLEVTKRGFSLDLKAGTDQPVLACAFRPVSGGAPWTLTLRGTGTYDPAFRGELRSGGAACAVRSVHHLEGMSLPLNAPAGFVFERDGQVIAMVETVNAGRVWLPGGADEGAIAAAATALLLFDPE